MSWTKELSDYAIALWGQGFNSAQIAERLGRRGFGVSRYAVVCRMHRLNQYHPSSRKITLVGPDYSIPDGYAQAERIAA